MFKNFKNGIIKSLGGTPPEDNLVETDVFNQIPLSNLGIGGLLGCSKTGSYDNTFPNISRIAEAFAEVMPFAVDANGEKLARQPRLIEILYNPNEEMSCTDFFETLITMLMVYPIVYLLCWHKEGRESVPGGPVTRDNISGLTFLEGYQVNIVGDSVTYTNGITTYTKNDVIALSLNVNPYDLLKGYSPSLAVKKWATTDDYIAEYQNGVFKNGAVPAGMFVVTAPSVKEFNDAVDSMQKHHRGARNANNPIYVHRPTSSIDGKPMQAQVEWTPFAQTNKDMTLEAIFNQANKKIDMNFGVPEEVKGHVSNSTYASAEVADYIFSRRVVYPKLVKVYSKLTHEFNRITGGLGYALSFDYEVPVLTDTRKIQVETLQSLLGSGFTLESAVNALQLPKSFLELQKEDQPVATPETTNEVANVEEVPTQNEEVEKPTKSIAKTKAMDIATETDQIWREPVNPLLRSQMLGAIKAVVSKAEEIIEDYGEIKSQDDIDKIMDELRKWLEETYNQRLADAVTPILLYIMLNSGNESTEEFANQLGAELGEFELPDEEREKYVKEITDLVAKYDDQTAEHIAAILAGITNGTVDQNSIDAMLDELKVTDEYRADRWAASEEHRAEETAVLVAALLAAEQTEMVAYKTWRVNPASPDMCIDCMNMNGETVRAGEEFSNGQLIPHYHPWCYCTVEWTFRPAGSKSVKVFCPNCKRYMFESSGGEVKNYICPNGKCKKHYHVKVVGGKVTAKEIGGIK